MMPWGNENLIKDNLLWCKKILKLTLKYLFLTKVEVYHSIIIHYWILIYSTPVNSFFSLNFHIFQFCSIESEICFYRSTIAENEFEHEVWVMNILFISVLYHLLYFSQVLLSFSREYITKLHCIYEFNNKLVKFFILIIKC